MHLFLRRCGGGLALGALLWTVPQGCGPSTGAGDGGIVVEPAHVDFGTVADIPIPFHRERVRILNRSQDALVVTKVTTSDGLRIELADGRLVPPQTSAEIVITLDARQREGVFEGEVAIGWEGTAERTIIPVRAQIDRVELGQILGPNVEIVGTTDWNFGQIQRQAIVYFDFMLRNSGTAPLVLESIETHCGCVQAWADQRTIAPGDTLAIHARVTPAVYPGDQPSKTITITTNDPDNPVLSLYVHGRILDSFVVEPVLADFGQVEPGDTPRMDVVIHARVPGLGRATDVTISSDFVSVERRAEAEIGTVVLAATLQLNADAPRGPFDLRLTATFDTPGVVDASVPIRGTVGAPLPVAPTAVNFGLVEENKVYRRILRVADVADSSTLTVDCQVNFLTAKIEQDDVGVRITLEYAPRHGMGEVRGDIVISDSATDRVRRVPVALQFQRESAGA